MKRRFEEGQEIRMLGVTVRVTRANDDDAFGNTPHYGFMWHDGVNWQQGWMPVVMFEQIAANPECGSDS